MDLSNMSLKDLRQLDQQITIQLNRTEKRERAEAIEEIYRIARSLGMPLKDLLRGGVPKAAAASAAFRDPDNPAHQWAGRGPRPQWLRDKLAAGVPLDSLRVVPA